ncbi:MAG: exo-alpha-sialidase [Bacteroidales bacterium]|nr:exo-alpha-sialidase [Bacteroidales bacterium]
MKTLIHKILLIIALLLPSTCAKAADTLFVREKQVPILLEREDNILFELKLTATTARQLDEIVLDLGTETNTRHIRAVKFYYGGTETRTSRQNAFHPIDYISSMDPGNTLKANPSYSICKARVRRPGSHVVLKAGQPLFPGVNYFWVSIEMKHKKAQLRDVITAQVSGATVDGAPATLESVSPRGIVHRMGVGVRKAGDDGSKAYRIPGLVTTNKGTLLAVYDVRYNNSKDLQEHIDIGLSRSTDGGRTWEKMRRPIAFGEQGGLPMAQNGAGDPAILVDTETGDAWIASIWTHGMGVATAWWSTVPGISPDYTAQLVMSKSSDDGKTWSQPVSVTPQIKDSTWAFFFQGPGRGITTSDGTIVFASQYTEFDAGRTPHAGIIYSRDHGKTWQRHVAAKDSTTEAQVAELSDGTLMLNMRDNRGGSRSVATTRDLGRTWTEHPSSRSALREPVCMASLIAVKADANLLGRHILLFSNPNTVRGRNHITIKASLDDGMTWKEANQVLLDEDEGWGYSCLTMVDPETVGILYESSVAHMTFQTVPLKDIVKELK